MDSSVGGIPTTCIISLLLIPSSPASQHKHPELTMTGAMNRLDEGMPLLQ